MNILVTGSAGRCGSVLCTHLEAHGHTVRCFDKEQGDLRDYAAVQTAVEGMDALAHLGAIPWNKPDHEEEVLSVNIQGTWNVLLACVKHNVRRVVVFSSVNAFGSFGVERPVSYLPGDDAYPSEQFHLYQLSKHLNEEMAEYFTLRHGLTVTAMRPMWVTSPELYTRWVNRTEDVGPAYDLFGYVDVRDVAEATRLALTKPDLTGFHACLLAADDTLCVTPTADVVAQHYPETPWRLPADEWLAENPHRALIDCKVAKEVLGWQPQYSWRPRS